MRLDQRVQLTLHRRLDFIGHLIVEQNPVEVVVLVLEHPGFEAVQGHLELFTAQVLRFNLDAGGPLRRVWG